MSKSICDSSVPQTDDQTWISVVNYDFNKAGFIFLVNHIINTAYGAKLRQLSADINANANGDYSVF